MVQGQIAGVKVERLTEKKQKSRIKSKAERLRKRQKKRSGITTLLSARVLVARLPPIDGWVKGSQEQQ